MNKIIGFIVFLLSFSSFNLVGQEVWSLEKCILHALQASIDIEQAEIGISHADINYKQAKQTRLPSLNGNSNLNWNFGRTVDPTSNRFVTETFFSNSYGLNTGISLFNGFRINNSIQQSKIDLEAAHSDSDQLERDVALLVASRYLNVLFAKENISIAERQLELSQQQLNQTIKSIEAGALAESESLNLEAQIAQSEQALIVSRNNLDISILQLKQTLRLDPSYPFDIELPEGINITTDPDNIYFEDAFAEAKKNRPDLTSSELRIISADYSIKLAKGLNSPSIRIGANIGTAYSNQTLQVVELIPIQVDNEVFISSNNPQLPLNNVPITISTNSFNPVLEKPSYSTQLDNNISYGFGVGMSIPIYNNGSTNSSIQRAKLNARSAQLNYDNLIETLKLTVQQSLADAKAAKKKLEASEKTLVAQKLAFENTSKKLELGSSNTFEWEAQKTQMENAEIQRLIDKYDYLFKIKILEFYLGKPLKLR